MLPVSRPIVHAAACTAPSESAPKADRSFSSDSAAESLSRMPASALATSASGQ